MTQAFTPMTQAPENLPVDVLAHYLNVADVLDVWTKRVRDEALRRAMLGEDIPGRKLVQKRATRSWPERDSALAGAITALMAFDRKPSDFWDNKLRSPAQLEKTLTKDEWTKLAPFVISKSSGVDLVPETDLRKAVPPPAVADFVDA